MSLPTEGTLKLYTGMEDKIISTKGLCMLVTDEGVGFFDDIQKKQKNHESDLSMLNQLFDGKGDRMTLVQNKECIVIPLPRQTKRTVFRDRPFPIIVVNKSTRRVLLYINLIRINVIIIIIIIISPP